MRTETSTSRAPTIDRMRAELARARRRFKAQPTPLRWSIGLAALAAGVVLTYAATNSPASAVGFVRSGDRFAADDRIKVCNALDKLHVRYRVDELNRVEVSAAQLDAANDAIAKLSVGPRPFSEIDQAADTPSLLDSIGAQKQRDERAISAKLEEMIRPMDGVVSAHVLVTRPKGGRGFRAAPAATAVVWLETEKDRELSSATVEAIQGLVAGVVPEVKRDGLSVFDRKGRRYLDASNVAIGAEAKIRHRRDELRQEILDKLEWLKGATVSVQLVASPAIPAPNPPAPLLTPTPAPAMPAGEVGLPPLSMRVNEPLDLTPETPEPLPALPAPVVTPPAPVIEPPTPRTRVWVTVPRSFYLRAARNREPSLDDLQPLVERTKGLIETAVRHVLPPDQLIEPVVISTIPDEAPTRLPTPAPQVESDARRLILWGVPAGFAAAALAGGLTAAFVMASRRPALRAVAPPRDDHGRYKIDEPSDSGPGPSERVRELIRLNPEAAASVLHRWTGQGGTLG